MVQGRIGDDLRAAFIVIDTGATSPYPIFLSEAAARRAGLAVSEPRRPESSTAIGAAVPTYRLARVPSFEVAGERSGAADVLVLPLIDDLSKRVGRPVHAIVGQQFLDGRVIAIDHGRREVDLDAAAGPASRAVAFTIAPAKPLILVRATINGRGPFTLEYDSGATGSSITPAAAARAGVKATGRTVISGAAGPVSARDGAAEIAVGAARARLPRVAISASVDAVARNAGAPLDGILGIDFFRNRRLTIDYPGRRLWIESSPGPESKVTLP